MATFTLFEQQMPGDLKKVPAGSGFNEGDQILINNRVLVDNNGNQKGTFVLRGTIVKSLPSGDALMSFEGSNNIFNKGVINTQGAVKLSDLAAGVTFAIVGGTRRFKKARGTVTVKTPKFTYKVRR
jgi:hypothetical protein